MNIKYPLIVLAACCMIVNALDNNGCPENFEFVNEKCYQIRLNEMSNWYEASRYCKQANSELVTIESIYQMNDLAEFLKKSGPETVWTAGTDLGSVGRFYWQSNGKEIEFTKWIKGQPRISRDKNCIMLKKHEDQDYYMYNVKCNTSMGFVCEVPVKIEFVSN